MSDAANSRRSRNVLAGQIPRLTKRSSGRTAVGSTPLNIRTNGPRVGSGFEQRIREVLSHKLGKYARRIERVTARFEDLNGPKGGIDISCRVKVVLSGLPSVFAENRAEREIDALNGAAAAAASAVRHALERSGLTRPGTRSRRVPRRPSVPAPSEAEPTYTADTGSLIGRRVGRSLENVRKVADRPEKVRRDAFVDTAQPGASASDRRAGAGATARRNTKLNRAGMSYALEDSATGRPSRKSTRRSMHHVKTDSNLRRRATRGTTSPKSRAERAAVEK